MKHGKLYTKSILNPNELNEAFHLTNLSDNKSKFRDLNVKLGEERILHCEERLKFPPISLKKRSPIYWTSVSKDHQNQTL